MNNGMRNISDSLNCGVVCSTQAKWSAHFDRLGVSSINVKARIILNQATVFLEKDGGLAAWWSYANERDVLPWGSDDRFWVDRELRHWFYD